MTPHATWTSEAIAADAIARVALTLFLIAHGSAAAAAATALKARPSTPVEAVNRQQVAVSSVDRDETASSRGTPLDLGRRVIREAIAAASETEEMGSSTASFGSGTGSRAQTIDRRFKDAEIPSCMTTAAFKFDPPRIGPISLPGILAAPWLLHAITTGKCGH